MVRLSTAQALSGIRALVPGFLAESPEVAFALQRARFQAAAAAGDGVRALRLARAELAPLAQACPHLLPQLKVLFAPPHESAVSVCGRQSPAGPPGVTLCH